MLLYEHYEKSENLLPQFLLLCRAGTVSKAEVFSCIIKKTVIHSHSLELQCCKNKAAI